MDILLVLAMRRCEQRFFLRKHSAHGYGLLRLTRIELPLLNEADIPSIRQAMGFTRKEMWMVFAYRAQTVTVDVCTGLGVLNSIICIAQYYLYYAALPVLRSIACLVQNDQLCAVLS